MRNSRFSEEQIVGMLKELQAGSDVTALCRRHDISVQTRSRWKSKYGELEVSDARRLTGLEDENVRVKRLVAGQALDNQALKALPRKPADSRCQAGRRSLSA